MGKSHRRTERNKPAARSCGRAPAAPPQTLSGHARAGRPRAANDNARRGGLRGWQVAAGLGVALMLAWLVAA